MSLLLLLNFLGVKRELMTMIRKGQIGYMGHILRGNGLKKDCLLGTIKGRRRDWMPDRGERAEAGEGRSVW